MSHQKLSEPAAVDAQGGTIKTASSIGKPVSLTTDSKVLARAHQDLHKEFVKKCPNSTKLSARAEQLIPGGVTHDNRRIAGTRLYVNSAKGARKKDADGNEYIDYWMGHGSLLLGHGRKEVIEAIHLAAQDVTHAGAGHLRELLWAEKVTELIPTAEKVRFTASGSEATALAVRLARAQTGRPTILKFLGHFHGWLDHAAVGYEPPFDIPFSCGVPHEVLGRTVAVPADLTSVEEELNRRKDIAAVIVEPTGGTGGALPLEKEFLKGLREITRSAGVLLIFDEVITGFRIAPGGAQEWFGVLPDLTCLAKVLAGGMPGGAVCGSGENMATMEFQADGSRNRRERVTQYGTFNANPVCAAAGIAALQLVADGVVCQKAEQFTEILRVQLNEMFRQEGIPLAAYGFSSVIHLLTGATDEEAIAVRDGKLNADELSTETLKRKSPIDPLLRRALQLEGIDWPPGKQAWVSAEHGSEELAETIEIFRRAIEHLQVRKCFH